MLSRTAGILPAFAEPFARRISFMTQKSRRQMLEEFVAKNPKDAFARYGLALECATSGDSQAAVEHFQQLLAHNANYVPGYYHFGQLLVKLARRDEARKILSDGIQVAAKAGDMHARDEMEAALRELD